MLGLFSSANTTFTGTHEKAGQINFFDRFQPFLLILMFSMIFHPKTRKTAENSVLSYSLKLVDTQTLSSVILLFLLTASGKPCPHDFTLYAIA